MTERDPKSGSSASAFAPEAEGVTPAMVRRFILLPETILRVQRYIKWRKVPAQDRDDVEHTIMMRALAATSLAETESKLRPWYASVADHGVTDYFRTRGVVERRETSLEEMHDVPTDAVIERYAKDILNPWITWKTRHDETDRTILAMIKEKANTGDTYEVVAARHGMTLAAFTSALFRLKTKHLPSWKRYKLSLGLVLLVLVLCALAVAAGRILFPPRPAPAPAEPWKPAPTATAMDVPFEPALPTAPTGDSAEALRLEAAQACASGAWPACVKKLDEAKAKDPASERDPRVVAMRTKIAKAAADSVRKAPP